MGVNKALCSVQVSAVLLASSFHQLARTVMDGMWAPIRFLSLGVYWSGSFILQVSATLLASSAQQPAGAVANGHAGSTGGLPALLQTLSELLDPDSLAEPSTELVDAALDAVSRLGATPGGAELFFTDAHGLPSHVATLALGRAGETC